MKCHVYMSEIVYHVVCAMFLGAACAGAGIALGLGRYFLAAVLALFGAFQLAFLVAWYWKITDRATYEAVGQFIEDEPWGRYAPSKAADDPLGD